MLSVSHSKNCPSILILTQLALILLAALQTGSVLANLQPNLFVPGEVMVQFKPNTEPDRLLTKALNSKPQDLNILKPSALLLSGKIEMPLTVKQLLSGRWVLFRLDSGQLLNDSLTRLRKKCGTAEIQLKVSDDKSLYRLTNQELDIAFKPSSREYKIVTDWKGSEKQEFTKLVDGFEEVLGYPVQGRVDSRKHLILELDQRNISLLMEKRLRQITSIIQAVQLNYISTYMQ